MISYPLSSLNAATAGGLRSFCFRVPSCTSRDRIVLSLIWDDVTSIPAAAPPTLPIPTSRVAPAVTAASLLPLNVIPLVVVRGGRRRQPVFTPARGPFITRIDHSPHPLLAEPQGPLI